LRFVSALAGVFAASCVLAPVALGAQSASQRADALLARMTPSEKLSLVGSGRAGVPRLGIPSLSFVDGPNGIGEGSPRVTSFPNARGPLSDRAAGRARDPGDSDRQDRFDVSTTWRVTGGRYRIYLGTSSRDLPQRTSLNVGGEPG